MIADVNAAGYEMKPEWFNPHYEFRFPQFGTIAQRGIELELRQGIEPWHVLGEESSGGGTGRFVDSTLERVQVLVNGMVDSRHVVTCNGQRVPLEGITLPECPWLIVQGDHDELVNHTEVIEWASKLAHAPQIALLPGAEHFFHGKLNELRDAVTSFTQQI